MLRISLEINTAGALYKIYISTYPCPDRHPIMSAVIHLSNWRNSPVQHNQCDLPSRRGSICHLFVITLRALRELFNYCTSHASTAFWNVRYFSLKRPLQFHSLTHTNVSRSAWFIYATNPQCSNSPFKPTTYCASVSSSPRFCLLVLASFHHHVQFIAKYAFISSQHGQSSWPGLGAPKLWSNPYIFGPITLNSIGIFFVVQIPVNQNVMFITPLQFMLCCCLYVFLRSLLYMVVLSNTDICHFVITSSWSSFIIHRSQQIIARSWWLFKDKTRKKYDSVVFVHASAALLCNCCHVTATPPLCSCSASALPLLCFCSAAALVNSACPTIPKPALEMDHIYCKSKNTEIEMQLSSEGWCAHSWMIFNWLNIIIREFQDHQEFWDLAKL